MIHFENVGLRYGMGPEVLRDLTFDIPKRSFQFLTGPSGAGKTTSAQMLMRFWDPDEGNIELGGHDLRDFKLDELRRHIALVSQDTFLLNATIRENLRMAKQDATEAEIEEAARLANASEFIEACRLMWSSTVTRSSAGSWVPIPWAWTWTSSGARHSVWQVRAGVGKA